MGVKLLSLKDWKAVCPKCEEAVLTNDDEVQCNNCDSPTIFKYAAGSARKFKSEETYFSWHGLYCKKQCGWHANQLQCPKCKATIKGRFLGPRYPIRHILSTSFQALLAIQVIGLFFIGLILLFLWLP